MLLVQRGVAQQGHPPVYSQLMPAVLYICHQFLQYFILKQEWVLDSKTYSDHDSSALRKTKCNRGKFLKGADWIIPSKKRLNDWSKIVKMYVQKKQFKELLKLQNQLKETYGVNIPHNFKFLFYVFLTPPAFPGVPSGRCPWRIIFSK